jgi:hypothetical protein
MVIRGLGFQQNCFSDITFVFFLALWGGMLQGFSMALTLNLMIRACFFCFCFSSSFLAADRERNYKTLGALGGIKKDFQQIQRKRERERRTEDAGRSSLPEWYFHLLSFST